MTDMDIKLPSMQELKCAQCRLLERLRQRLNEINVPAGWKTETRPRNGNGGGLCPLYYWITLKIYDKNNPDPANIKRFWLALFFNDIDLHSGNTHTHFGWIQYWKNIKKLPGKTGLTPHDMCPYGRVFFNTSNMWPDKVANAINIMDENYNREQVITDFIDFVNKNI